VCVCVCVWVCVCVPVNAYVCVCVPVCVYMCAYLSISVCVSVYIDGCACQYAYLCVCVPVCVCICQCIHRRVTFLATWRKRRPYVSLYKCTIIEKETYYGSKRDLLVCMLHSPCIRTLFIIYIYRIICDTNTDLYYTDWCTQKKAQTMWGIWTVYTNTESVPVSVCLNLKTLKKLCGQKSRHTKTNKKLKKPVRTKERHIGTQNLQTGAKKSQTSVP